MSSVIKTSNIKMEKIQLEAIAICPKPTPIKIEGIEPSVVNKIYFGYLMFRPAAKTQIRP